MYVCGYACMHVFMDVCLTVNLNYVEKHVFTTKCNGRNSQVLFSHDSFRLPGQSDTER